MLNVGYKIPNEINVYPEDTEPQDTAPFDHKPDRIIYEPKPGEIVQVLSWERWPGYDFIFGVPDIASPKYAKEVAYFNFRDGRSKNVDFGIYIDIDELISLLSGFRKLRMISPDHSPELWKQYREGELSKLMDHNE